MVILTGDKTKMAFFYRFKLLFLRLTPTIAISSNSLSTLDNSSLDKAYMQSIASRLAAFFLCARMVYSPPMEGRLAPLASR